MVDVIARKAFSLDIFNFSQIYKAESYVSKNTEFVAVYDAGEDHFFGKNFTYNADGVVKGGTVTSYQYEFSGQVMYDMQGFSLSVQSVIKASKTNTLADDMAILTKLFSGADMLNGSGDADRLEGLAGKDKLFGNGGADLLIGGSGDDQLTGGAASDHFAFAKGCGVDTITDFAATGAKHDFIELGGYKGINSIDDVEIKSSRSGAIIELDGGDKIILSGVKAADLDTADFNF